MVYDSDLNSIIENSKTTNDDLDFLVELIKKKASNFLEIDVKYKEYAPNHKMYADVIADEIRLFGGNSFVNVFRDEGPCYKEIVCDVADKLKAPYNSNNTIEHIENSILETVLEKALEKMSAEEKNQLLSALEKESGNSLKGQLTTAALMGLFRAGGFWSYQIALQVANQIARMVLGHGLKLATNAALVKSLSILTGPIGWAITAVWVAIDFAGPSYKVTIPAVIYVAMLRKKLNTPTCPHCHKMIPAGSKFCPECGRNLS